MTDFCEEGQCVVKNYGDRGWRCMRCWNEFRPLLEPLPDDVRHIVLDLESHEKKHSTPRDGEK